MSMENQSSPLVTQNPSATLILAYIYPYRAIKPNPSGGPVSLKRTLAKLE
jgi:hypothetical protein